MNTGYVVVESSNMLHFFCTCFTSEEILKNHSKPYSPAKWTGADLRKAERNLLRLPAFGRTQGSGGKPEAS